MDSWVTFHTMSKEMHMKQHFGEKCWCPNLIKPNDWLQQKLQDKFIKTPEQWFSSKGDALTAPLTTDVNQSPRLHLCGFPLSVWLTLHQTVAILSHGPDGQKHSHLLKIEFSQSYEADKQLIEPHSMTQQREILSGSSNKPIKRRLNTLPALIILL